MVSMNAGYWAMADIVDFCKHGTAGHTGMMAERYNDGDVLNVMGHYTGHTVTHLKANHVVINVYYCDGEHVEAQIRVVQ